VQRKKNASDFPVLLGINLIRDSIFNRIDVGVGVVWLTLLKRQNRGILYHATINIYSPSNGLILLPTITACHHSWYIDNESGRD